MVLKHGTRTVYNLCTMIHYPEAKKIHERAFRVCIMALFDATREKTPVEMIFGCRDSLSQGEGYWDGAFVVIKCKNGQLRTYFFKDGFDSVEEPGNITNALKVYNSYLQQGWKPMTVDDATKTTGVIIDNATSLRPPVCISKAKKAIMGSLAIVAIVTTSKLLKRK